MARKPVAPASLTEVVAAGDLRASLEAVRDHLARTIADAEPPNVAALAKQLQAVLTQLAELPPPRTESNPVDDLATRRRVRRSDTASAGRAGSGDVGRRRGG